MSITDKQDDPIEKESTSEKAQVATEETTEITDKTQDGSPSGKSTDAEENSTSDEITEENSEKKRPATPEESRSFYERKKQENEAKKVAETKWERMQQIRQEIAAEPSSINNFEGTRDADLVNEMMAAGDPVINQAFDDYHPKGAKAKNPASNLDKILDEKLKKREEERERINAFNKVNELYPGFKNSAAEREAIDELGGIDIVSMMPASKLYSNLKRIAAEKLEKAPDKTAEAQKNIHNQSVPGSSGKSSAVRMTPAQRKLFDARINQSMTAERWLELQSR